jgi:predicted nucleic acid-binding protein
MIIVDTGFWLALGNRSDKYHDVANLYLDNLSERLITTHPVITETCYLLLDRLGNYAQSKFVANVAAGAFDVFDLDIHDYRRIEELMQKYRDLPMDLADASLIVLAEHLGHGRILSTDLRDFNIYRWNNQNPFENLLLKT